MRRLFPSLFMLLLIAGCSLMAISPAPKVAKANGTELAYVEAGQSTPVVFVHGTVSDYRYWEPQRAAIAERHRFVAYSLRYHEPNRWQDDGAQYSVQTHVDDLAAFIQSLNAGPVHLVGHSYGGDVAIRVALSHPELVKTLTLVEPGIWTLAVESPEGKTALNGVVKIIPTIQERIKADHALEGGEPVTRLGAG